MSRSGYFFAISLVVSVWCAALAADTTEKSMAEFATDPSPWLHIAANSEQRQPLYLGATPREMALALPPADAGDIALYEVLRPLGESQIRQVRDALAKTGAITHGERLQFEAWPVRDDYGQLTWAFAAWRTGGDRPWRRLDASLLPENRDPYRTRWPMLPVTLDPMEKEDFSLLFADVLTLTALYDKPLFGDCVWTADDGRITEAWLPVDLREEYAKKIAEGIKEKGASPKCYVLPQPARLNGKPITFVLRAEGDAVIWPTAISWKKEETSLPGAASPGRETPIRSWPADFTAAYKSDVMALDGEEAAVFPVSGRTARFTNKNSVDAKNQIMDLVSYLEERYKKHGIATRRQEFIWRGIPQANLIAIIPGTDPSARPVLMADHIDTAFCEDIFEETGKTQRVSAPGADDNCSATAVLLRAAEILPGLKLKHPVWLVHLTGEEFPGDDLGARYLVSGLLKEKTDIEGLVLMDMIGYREKGDRLFQINPGDSPQSLMMARIALDAARRITDLEPVIRTRFDEKSYLYNTDGLIFADNGFPVVYLNEHLNKLENLYRKGYHHSTDTSKMMDWEYASAIGKVAIATVAAIAEGPSAPAGTMREAAGSN